MTHKLLPALSLSALLLACAHDRNQAAVNDPSGVEDGRGADQVADAEGGPGAKAQGDEARAESDVDMPQRRGQRNRMASAGNELPSERDKGSETASEHEADNTGINERDRGGNNLTPLDQGNDQIDIDLTQRIRKALMKDDSLSFTAKNIKVITRDGQVVLRGPVKSEQEKQAVFRAASNEAGAGRVTNQLEVEQD